MRLCSECGKPMKEGYTIDNGLEYYCSDECLHKNYTEEQWKEMYNDDGDNYWTEWEDYDTEDDSIKDIFQKLGYKYQRILQWAEKKSEIIIFNENGKIVFDLIGKKLTTTKTEFNELELIGINKIVKKYIVGG